MLYTAPTLDMPHRQTLAESAVRVLLAHLATGRWTEFLPGERDLCAEFQISRPTLRQALQVLERKGYVEVAQGRHRRIIQKQVMGTPAARQNVIGLISPVKLRSLPPFVLFWIDEVRANLAKEGYRLEFHASHASDARHPDRALQRLVYGTPAALWILLLAPPIVQQWFMEKKVPCLLAGASSPGINLPSIDIDYRAACRHAVGVFRRGGHERLALVIPATGLVGDSDSEAGFCEAATGSAAPVILRHDGTPEDLIRRLEGCLRLQSPPTGFLVARSAHALTVLTVLLRRGLKLPSQAAVISRDDDAFLDFVTPRVVRYSANPAIFARRLFQFIFQMVQNGPIQTRSVRLMPAFRPGETV